MYLHSPTGIEARLMNVKKKIRETLENEDHPARKVQLAEELSNYVDELFEDALKERDRQEYIDAVQEEEE